VYLIIVAKKIDDFPLRVFVSSVLKKNSRKIIFNTKTQSPQKNTRI